MKFEMLELRSWKLDVGRIILKNEPENLLII